MVKKHDFRLGGAHSVPANFSLTHDEESATSAPIVRTLSHLGQDCFVRVLCLRIWSWTSDHADMDHAFDVFTFQRSSLVRMRKKCNFVHTVCT